MIIHADVVRWLRENEWLMQSGFMPKYHAVLADPPYFLGSIAKRFGKADAAPARYGADGAFQRQSRGFMGQTWDGFADVWEYQVWVTEWARLMLSFVYPGAVLMMFGGSRTYHRLAAGIEDAGWEVFDCIQYVYGSGFPKAADVGKKGGGEDFEGYKTAIKPAYEPIVVARAPRGNYTFAELARQFGTGAINVDGGRIGVDLVGWRDRASQGYSGGLDSDEKGGRPVEGRYPANFILGCACESYQHVEDCPVALMDAQSGERKAGGSKTGNEPSARTLNVYGKYQKVPWAGYEDTGGASRFFYTAKSASWEREAGLEDFAAQTVTDGRETPIDNAYQRGETLRHNVHPTIKPIKLTEYLARLILPPALNESRRLLVPFSGVASEMIGATLAGWDEVTGIEMTAEYLPIAETRLNWWGRFTSYAEAKAAAGIIDPVDEADDEAIQMQLFENV